MMDMDVWLKFVERWERGGITTVEAGEWVLGHSRELLAQIQLIKDRQAIQETRHNGLAFQMETLERLVRTLSAGRGANGEIYYLTFDI